jgi:hypothetical protein
MPTTAQLDIYNGTRGEITVPESSVEFTGIPVMGEIIDQKATQILNNMNDAADSATNKVHRISWNYNWDVTKNRLDKLASTPGYVMKPQHIVDTYE